LVYLFYITPLKHILPRRGRFNKNCERNLPAWAFIPSVCLVSTYQILLGSLVKILTPKQGCTTWIGTLGTLSLIVRWFVATW